MCGPERHYTTTTAAKPSQGGAQVNTRLTPPHRRRQLTPAFEAVMTREDRTKGFFVAFDYTSDALREIDGFFRKSG